MMKMLKQQKGVSLLMAILLVVIITAVISQVSLRTVFSIKRSAALNYSDYADVYQKIALKYAISTLQRDNNQSSYDGYDEKWAYKPPAYSIEGGEVSGYINELSSRYNLAQLQTGTLFSQTVLKRLLDNIGIGAEFANKITAVVQSGQYYSAIGVMSAAGLNHQQMNALIRYVCYLPVTGTPLNINLVSPKLFAAYLDLSSSRADNLLSSLRTEPITTKEELYQFSIENNLNIIYIIDNDGNETTQGVVESFFDVQSRFFQVIGLVKIDRLTSTYVTNVDRVGNVIDILNQRVNKLVNE